MKQKEVDAGRNKMNELAAKMANMEGKTDEEKAEIRVKHAKAKEEAALALSKMKMMGKDALKMRKEKDHKKLGLTKEDAAKKDKAATGAAASKADKAKEANVKKG